MWDFLVFIAAAASLSAALVYIRSMFGGQTKPNRVTWFMWCIAPFVATAAEVSDGVGWAVLPVFMSGLCPFLIFTSSFFTKEAYWKNTAFDLSCGGLSTVALLLWYVTSNPNIAIVFAIVSDALAGVPTMLKAWRHPESESAWPYIIGMFAPLTSFAVLASWSFSGVAFPAYLAVINVLIVASISKKWIRQVGIKGID
jgi:hypothetical protein